MNRRGWTFCAIAVLGVLAIGVFVGRTTVPDIAPTPAPTVPVSPHATIEIVPMPPGASVAERVGPTPAATAIRPPRHGRRKPMTPPLVVPPDDPGTVTTTNSW